MRNHQQLLIMKRRKQQIYTMHQLITEKVFFMQRINNKNTCKKSKKLIILKGDCVCKHSQWIRR